MCLSFLIGLKYVCAELCCVLSFFTLVLQYYFEPLEPLLQSLPYFPICKIWTTILKYFAMYFKDYRRKTERARLCIFWKTLWWPEQHLSIFIGNDKLLCSPAHIMSLSFSKSVKHSWMKPQQMLPFTYFLLFPFTLSTSVLVKDLIRNPFFFFPLELLFFIWWLYDKIYKVSKITVVLLVMHREQFN